jgi:hypothetical protein
MIESNKIGHITGPPSIKNSTILSITSSEYEICGHSYTNWCSKIIPTDGLLHHKNSKRHEH